MTLFRPHRGGLEEAMKEVVDLPDFAALVAHLNTIHGSLNAHFGVPPYKPEQVKVEPYGGFDKRIGWQTYIVTVDGQAVGFTNGPMA